jgi:hypothetical protein
MRYSNLLGGLDKVIQRFSSASVLAQGFESNVGADLVPKLEAVGDGSRRGCHADGGAFDPVRFDPALKRRARESNNSHRRELNLGLASLAGDSHPNLGRILRA